MGLLDWLFGAKRSRRQVAAVDHPVFGSVFMDTDSSWFAETVDPLGCKGRPSVSIDGNESGPAEGSVATYHRLRSEWDSIGPLVAEVLLELNHNYFSEEPAMMLNAAEDVWPTAKLLSMSVAPDGRFDLTYVFDWQDSQDDHQVTVYFENWACKGSSIDG